MYCRRSGSQHLLLCAKTRVLKHGPEVFKTFDCLKTHDTFKIGNESLPDLVLVACPGNDRKQGGSFWENCVSCCNRICIICPACAADSFCNGSDAREEVQVEH